MTSSSPCLLRDVKEGRYVVRCNNNDDGSVIMIQRSFGSPMPLLPGYKQYVFEFPDQRSAVQECDNDKESQVVSFLGGQADDSDSQRKEPYSEASIFHRLPRPRQIPVSSKHNNTIQPPIYPQGATTTFEKLMNGDFIICIVEQPGFFAVQLVASTSVNNPDDGSSQEESMSIIIGMVIGAICGLGIGEQASNDPTFWQALNKPQRRALVQRVLHRLLRSRGSILPAEFVYVAAGYLIDSYLSNRQYPEALDVAILVADVAVSHGKSTILDFVFYRVAEILETCERYIDAADMYLEFAEQAMMDSPKELSIAYMNAGLAYKRAADYTLAEQCYVKALFYDDKPSLDTSKTWSMIWSNLISLYFNDDRWDATGGDVRFGLEKSGQCLLGLLFVLKFPFAEQHKCLVPTAKSYAACLYPRFKVPAQALEALVDATSTDSLADFRFKLNSCWDKNVNACVSVCMEKPGRKEYRRTARETAMTPMGDQLIPEQCYGPGCKVTVGLRDCPCHTVFYCSKDCQRKHWRHSHKHNCPKKQNGGM